MFIRPLTALEREDVRNFYLSLSADDRRKRFCCSLSDETISKYVDRLNFTRDTVLGALDEQAQIMGLAELVRGPKESEMAFSVRPDRRGQKIGTKLLEGLIALAGICGIKRVFVMFLSDNTPMRKMATRAGMPVDTADGESYASREVPPPSAEDFARWLAEDGLAHTGYLNAQDEAQRSALPDRSPSPVPAQVTPRAPAANLAPVA